MPLFFPQTLPYILSLCLSADQEGRPAFIPPLPQRLQSAIASLNMRAGTKLFFVFKRRLWPESMPYMAHTGLFTRVRLTAAVPSEDGDFVTCIVVDSGIWSRTAGGAGRTDRRVRHGGQGGRCGLNDRGRSSGMRTEGTVGIIGVPIKLLVSSEIQQMLYRARLLHVVLRSQTAARNSAKRVREVQTHIVGERPARPGRLRELPSGLRARSREIVRALLRWAPPVCWRGDRLSHEPTDRARSDRKRHSRRIDGRRLQLRGGDLGHNSPRSRVVALAVQHDSLNYLGILCAFMKRCMRWQKPAIRIFRLTRKGVRMRKAYDRKYLCPMLYPSALAGERIPPIVMFVRSVCESSPSRIVAGRYAVYDDQVHA